MASRSNIKLIGKMMAGTCWFLVLAVFTGSAPLALQANTLVTGSVLKNQAVFERYIYRGQTLEQVIVGPDEYRNPIISGYYPDPSTTRVEGDYYLVNSSFTHYPGLPVFHSTDLVNWSQVSNAISRENQFDFNGLTVSRGIFAPDISYNDGLYYIASTCVDCGGNFVMTAKDPAGPWSDPAWLDFEGIDPSIYWEGDKAFILNNGAPPEPPQYEGHRAIWIQEFDWKNLQMRGERKVLVNGGVDITKKPIWIEGPHIFRKGDFYYLTAAEGGTGDQHSQTIFRSNSVWGPFEPAKRNPILTQRDLDPARSDPVTSAGHAKFVQLPNGDWWATFLATRPYGPDLYNIGRETFLLPVTWKNGWPGILPAGELIPYVHSRPALPEGPAPRIPTSGDFGFTDEFDGTTLGMEWIGLRTPGKPVYTLGDGQLAMDCSGSFGDLSGPPSFIGRRQQHHVASATTTFSFSPRSNGDRAGLAAVQNDSSLIFFGTERIDDQNHLVISTRDKSNEDMQVKKISLAPAENLTLSMRVNGGKMDFEYSHDGQEFSLAKGVDARILSTSRAGGFVGTVIGLYCEAKSVNADT